MNEKYPTLPDGMALTAVAVAQERAVESASADGLVNDPFARTLVDAAVAGAPKMTPQWQMLADGVTPSAAVPALQGFLPLRTRWIDDAVLRAGIPQVVVLGAGFDTRALRLDWADGVTIVTVDQPEVVDFVSAVLAGTEPGARWSPLAADLAGQWAGALARSDAFSPETATVWVIEGLLMYLEPDQVDSLLDGVHELSAPSSVVLADVPNSGALSGETFTGGRETLRENASPVRSAVGDPVSWFADRGWRARVIDAVALAESYGSPVPLVLDPATPDGPTFHLVEATFGSTK